MAPTLPPTRTWAPGGDDSPPVAVAFRPPEYQGMRQREVPGPGQESVWDYPRPPRLESADAPIVVEFNGVRVIETQRSLRVLETSHPPVHYLHPDDFPFGALQPTDARRSWCEFKGT